jgi:hypothetical protein
MGFVDSNSPVGVAYIVVFAILAAFFAGTAVMIWRATHSQYHYAQSIVLAYVFPLCPIIFAIDTIVLSINASSPTIALTDPVQTLGNVIQPFAIPILLDVLYEVCYLVHKRRSVNFFGLEFDQGHRVKIISSTTRSFVLRNFIRVLALALLVIGLLANFEIVFQEPPPSTISTETPSLSTTTTTFHETTSSTNRKGWLGLFPWTGQVWLLFELIPSLCLFILTFFLSILLWRYGTSYSIHVHSSMFNPWCCQFFGNLAMGVGQCFPPPNIYYISCHVGFLLLLWSVLAVMKEITKDLLAEEDFEDFLKDVARMGNRYSVTTKVMMMRKSSQQQQQPNDVKQQNEGTEDSNIPMPPPPPLPITPSISPTRLNSDWEEDVTLEQVLQDVEAVCHRINRDHASPSTKNLRRTL